MSTFLVTGGAGFIGSHIAERLLERRQHVRVLDNFSTGKRQNISRFAVKVEVIEADVRDLGAVEKAMEGTDCCFHEAALGSVPRSIKDPRESMDVNVKGTLNVLVSARNNRRTRVVYAGSSSVYGSNPVMPRVETLVPEPVSPYALSKLIGEYYCILFNREFGVPVVALRYFNVFGGRQDADSPYAAVVPRFLDAIRRGKRPVIYGDGCQTRDFTHVDNVIDANLLAWNNLKAEGEVFNIGCGKQTSVNELLSTLGRIMGVEVSPVHEKQRKGDPRRSCAGIEKARDVMGYEPGVSLVEGLKKLINE